MITVNIRKQGGAAIMTIPSDVLKVLNVEVGASLELEVTDGFFTARPVRPQPGSATRWPSYCAARRRKTWPRSKWTPPGRARANRSAARWHDSPQDRATG